MPRRGLAVVVSLLAALACSNVLGIHAIEQSTDAGAESSSSSGGPRDADDEEAGPPLVDSSWAQWPMPNAPAPTGVPNPALSTNNQGTLTGTTVDNITMLLWQQTPTGNGGVAFPTGTQAQAAAYCQSLDFRGVKDWRLPEVIELVSIVDYAETPADNPAWFPETPQDVPFWSATPTTRSAGATQFWELDFSHGDVTEDDGSLERHFRCVSSMTLPSAPGAAPATRYTTFQDTVADLATGLTWQMYPSSNGATGNTPVAMTWSQAQAYCPALMTNGSGWRMPTISELATLSDYSNGGVIDSAALHGGAIQSDGFWSSTLVDGGTTPWTLTSGATSYDGTSTSNFVWCVR